MTLEKLQIKNNCFVDANIQSIARSLIVDFEKEFNIKNSPKIYAIFSNGTLSWFGDKKEYDKFETYTTRIILENPKIAHICKKKLFEGAKEYNIYTKRLQRTDFLGLTDKGLAKVYKDYTTRYRKLYLWGEPFAFYVKDKLTDYILEYIKKRSKNPHRDISCLLSPNYISFAKREELDMLKLAIKVKKDKKLLDNLIKQHTKKYFWIPYDYGVMIWSEKHFLAEYKKVKNPEKKLEKIKKYHSDLKKDQRDLVKKLKIDKRYLELIEVQKIFAVLMDYKKEIFTKAHFAFKGLITEIAKRLDLTLDQAKIMYDKEILENLTKGKKHDKKILDARIDFSYYSINEEGEYRAITGDKAKKIYQNLLFSEVEETKEIKGFPASKGTYKGIVKVILNARNIDTLNEGEILVTHMTSPDYTAGMKRAGAIVTDEGGITSHAAIVSRELGVPCVIGTKMATDVLKDGDLVEVDANKGVVRRIE